MEAVENQVLTFALETRLVVHAADEEAKALKTVNDAMKEKGISVAKMAFLVDVSEAALTKILKGVRSGPRRSPKLTIELLAKMLYILEAKEGGVWDVMIPSAVKMKEGE